MKIEEGYQDYDTALYHVRGIVNNLRKTFDDDTIEMAFTQALHESVNSTEALKEKASALKSRLASLKEEEDLKDELDDMEFSKTTATKKGSKIVKTKPNGDKVVQSKEGPVAKATTAVLDKAGTEEGTVKTLRSYDGDDKKIKKQAGQFLGQPGVYGADTDNDGKVDDAYIVSKSDIDNAKVESRKATLKKISEARRMALIKDLNEDK